MKTSTVYFSTKNLQKSVKNCQVHTFLYSWILTFAFLYGIVKKYSDFDELTPEILRAYIDKVYIYEKQKVDGHYTHTVEIIYNLVGAIDLPDFGDLLDEEN